MWVDQPQFTGVARVVKRAMDVVVPALLLVLGSPFLLLIALLVRAHQPRPGAVPQRADRREGRLITVYKFRSMYADAESGAPSCCELNESAGGVLFKMRDDPRVTPVGRVLRKFSLDELPQLFNVLRRLDVAGRAASAVAGRGRAVPLRRPSPPAGQARHDRPVAGQRAQRPVLGRSGAARTSTTSRTGRSAWISRSSCAPSGRCCAAKAPTDPLHGRLRLLGPRSVDPGHTRRTVLPAGSGPPLAPMSFGNKLEAPRAPLLISREPCDRRGGGTREHSIDRGAPPRGHGRR